MTTVPHVSPDNLIQLFESLIHPPLQFVDAATEDVTARVLHGLGVGGVTLDLPSVQRALAFLRDQQCDSGAFWGRWICNYLPATAFVLLGATAVGENPDAPWLQRAVSWTLTRQNADGGWGESAASYVDPALAGIGPSSAPCTGIVLQGLAAAGVATGPAIERAVEYLLSAQRSDGAWDNGTFLATNIPPNGFYAYPESARYLPLEALGRLRSTMG
jgi:squalene-hopene/tetraprenyl-beta-curcumene cyclase